MATMNTTTSPAEVEVDSSLHANYQPTPTAPLSVCPLCCEENFSTSSTEGVVLLTCHHHSCQACLAKWIEKEEESGQTQPPTCPFCRSNISEEDVLVILGRPFQPRETGANDPNGDDEIDELTLHWINEHTVPCGGCGSLIEKADGCDKIECLCGYRFCYRCGSPGGGCECNPGHRFLDNHEYIADAPLRDGNGHVDLRSCILRRKVRREREYQRNEKRDEELSRWYCYSAKNSGVCTSNGGWLFSPKKNTGSISMLIQQLSYESISDERESKTWTESDSNASHDAPWLFLCHGADIRALRKILVRDDIQWPRREKKWRLNDEMKYLDRERGLGLVWLFLPNRTGFRVLAGMDDAMRKRLSRARAHSRKNQMSLWGKLRTRGRKKEEEKQCLESILLVFPWQDEEE